MKRLVAFFSYQTSQVLKFIVVGLETGQNETLTVLMESASAEFGEFCAFGTEGRMKLIEEMRRGLIGEKSAVEVALGGIAAVEGAVAGYVEGWGRGTLEVKLQVVQGVFAMLELLK